MSLAEFYICNGINPYDSDSFDAFFGGREWEAERLQDFSDEDSFDDEDETISSDSTESAGCELFIHGVGASYSYAEKLKEELISCGKVLDVENTGKGYVFVTMETKAEAEAVILKYGANGAQLLGREVRVEVSRRNKRGQSGGGDAGVRNCRNGRYCSFKPKCRFYHQEGGNSKGAGRAANVVMAGSSNLKGDSRAAKVTLVGGEKKKSEEKVEMMVCQFGGRSWEKANKKMLAAVDEEVYKGFIQEQVNLLGGCKRFYEKVADSLTHERLIGFISEDQKALYEWRSKFFHEKLKCTYFGDRPGEADSTFFWTTQGNDDAHCCDTLPYQITENFDVIMKLAASTVKLDVFNERIYLENWEGSAGKFFQYEKWDNSCSRYEEEEWEEEDYDHAELFEDGKLTDCLFDCKDCEGFQSENKDCGSRKKKYMEYLLGSESIKEKYWKWKKEEDEGLDDEGVSDEENED